MFGLRFLEPVLRFLQFTAPARTARQDRKQILLIFFQSLGNARELIVILTDLGQEIEVSELLALDLRVFE